MMHILDADELITELAVPVVIIGGGACGMVAALASYEAGIEPLIIERDKVPHGSTGLSSGMIPACNTRFQREQNISDNVSSFVDDIQQKANNQVDAVILETICRSSGPTIEWLVDEHQVMLTLVEGFLYPGHSCLRMHAPPSRRGADLILALNNAVKCLGIDISTNSVATQLYADRTGYINGVRILHPDGTFESVACKAVILACNGFGGNREMLEMFSPEIAKAEYFGHPGNQGDAVKWGLALGAAVSCMGAYQGHGSIAIPQKILITWALIMQGGIQVNREGHRFTNEHLGYSEQTVEVLKQSDSIAWVIFDDRIRNLGRDFDDFNQAESIGAVRTGCSAEILGNKTGINTKNLNETILSCQKMAEGKLVDGFGRDFTTAPALEPPYHAIKVTGALLHTQGGLKITHEARVLNANGKVFPNLLAGGGAACGVSGEKVQGYLSGNGLLTAVTLGRIAGKTAAKLVNSACYQKQEF